MSPVITSLASRARAVARFGRRLPDRILHPWRRRRLSSALARSGPVRGVLFVCHGNICRSPYAAAVFRQRLPPALRPHVVIGSAGFIGPNRPSPAEALAVSARRGIDLSTHRSQLITVEELQKYDLIVVMGADQVTSLLNNYPTNSRVIVLGDLDPLPIKTRTIPDPIDQSEKVFDESYARIDRCVEMLISSVYSFAAGKPPHQGAPI